MAQFYSARTSFPTEPDHFRQKTFFCLPRIGKDASAIQERQGHQTISKECVLKVNYGKYTQNILRGAYPPFGEGIHSSVTRREHEIVGRVPIGRAYYLPPANQMEEACIRVFPDIPVPQFPIRITGIFDLVRSQCFAANLIELIVSHTYTSCVRRTNDQRGNGSRGRDGLHGSVPPFGGPSVLPDQRIIIITALEFLYRARKALFVGRIVANSAVRVYGPSLGLNHRLLPVNSSWARILHEGRCDMEYGNGNLRALKIEHHFEWVTTHSYKVPSAWKKTSM